jgi:endonuclease/exonuclease/phosphatase family metal-dependent hydrolase
MSSLRRCLFALFVVALSVSALPVGAQTLSVMSLNVRLPVATDGPNRWENRRDLMAQLIRQAHPDIIGTQELYREQGDQLVERLPEYTWFGRGRRGDDGDEHMGVFYRRDRLQVIESGDFWLSDTPDVPGSITWGHPFPRMVTWALFKRVADGKQFYFFNTHLPYRESDDEARLRGAELTLRRLRSLPADIPVIVTGDFNTGPTSAVHERLTGYLQDARIAAAQRSGPEGTFHDFTGKPQLRIDWILFRGMRANRFDTLTTSRNGAYPSDHFAVQAELAF